MEGNLDEIPIRFVPELCAVLIPKLTQEGELYGVFNRTEKLIG